MEAFHVHLAETLVDLGFGHAEQSHRLLQRLRRLFHRARPDRVELNILRGILSAAQGRRRAAGRTAGGCAGRATDPRPVRLPLHWRPPIRGAGR